MATAFITPKMLTWAIERAGNDRVRLIEGTEISLQDLADWELGVSQPSLKEVALLSDLLAIPFGFFWLSAPPVTKVPSDLNLKSAIDTYIEDLRFRMYERAEIGEERYHGLWKALTQDELQAMLEEEEDDVHVYKAMLRFKLNGLLR